MRIRSLDCRMVVAVALLMLSAVSVASADALQVNLDWASTPWLYGGGGPFKATVVNGPIGVNATGSSFFTFCVEDGEYFYPGSTYYAVVSDRARTGTGGIDGTDALGPYDILSFQSAYLYTNFVAGTMSLVDSSWQGVVGSTDPQAISDLEDLQRAIWYFEGESIDPNSDTTLHNLVTAANTAVTSGVWVGKGQGNVRVMQMWTQYDPSTGTYSGNAQDQLVLVPTPTASMAGLSLLGGLGLVGWIKRRRNVLD